MFLSQHTTCVWYFVSYIFHEMWNIYIVLLCVDVKHKSSIHPRIIFSLYHHGEGRKFFHFCDKWKYPKCDSKHTTICYEHIFIFNPYLSRQRNDILQKHIHACIWGKRRQGIFPIHRYNNIWGMRRGCSFDATWFVCVARQTQQIYYIVAK